VKAINKKRKEDDRISEMVKIKKEWNNFGW